MSVLRVPRTQQGIALGRNTLALLAWKTAVSINPTASRLKRGSLNLAARVIPRRGPCTWQLGHALNRRVLAALPAALCWNWLAHRDTPERAGHEVPAFVQGVLELRRIRVEALYTDQIEARAAPGTDGGVGPVLHPVVAHALAEVHQADQQVRHLGRTKLAVDSGWEQVLAAGLGRVELGASDAELLRARELCIGGAGWGRGSPARDASARNGRRRAAGSALTLPHSLSCRPRWMMSCRRTPSPAGLKRPCR